METAERRVFFVGLSTVFEASGSSSDLVVCSDRRRAGKRREGASFMRSLMGCLAFSRLRSAALIELSSSFLSVGTVGIDSSAGVEFCLLEDRRVFGVVIEDADCLGLGSFGALSSRSGYFQTLRVVTFIRRCFGPHPSPSPRRPSSFLFSFGLLWSHIVDNSLNYMPFSPGQAKPSESGF